MTCKMILECVGVTKYLGTLSSVAGSGAGSGDSVEYSTGCLGMLGFSPVRFILVILAVFVHGGEEKLGLLRPASLKLLTLISLY